MTSTQTTEVPKTIIFSTNDLFLKLVDATPSSIDFDPSWANGTGYLDGLVRTDLNLSEGDVVKTIDNFGRHILVIVTPKGNLVLFERYSEPNSAVVSNSDSFFEKFGILPPGQLSPSTLINLFQLTAFETQIFGKLGTGNNIGKAMAR